MLQKKNIKIAIVGEPNVGKSTLFNTLVGSKLSIVTHKVQTTQKNIKGSLILDDQLSNSSIQIIFKDTPGIFKPSNERNRKIVKEAWKGLDDVSLIFLVFDARKQHDMSEDIEIIVRRIRERNIDACAIVNKIDLVKKETLLDFAKRIHDLGVFTEVFMVSAIRSKGIEPIFKYIASSTKDEGYAMDENRITDTSFSEIAEEITREKVMLLIHDEIPYAVRVTTEKYEETDKKVTIHQCLHVERKSHKSILIGKKASKIKEIGLRSKESILEHVDNKPVDLFLHVVIGN